MHVFRAPLAALLAAVALAGCGKTWLPATTAPQGAADALMRWPGQSIVVPGHPTREPEPVTTGNRGVLRVSAPETLPALEDLITSAKHSIYFETFNFVNDSMGRHIYPLLAQRAKEGLEVKLVTDYVGTRFQKGYGDMAKQLADAGVDFILYKPRTIIKDDHRHGINITHRKVYLADGERALIGGVNIMAPFDTTVQDVLVDWHGPVVGTAYQEFALDWAAAGGGALGQAPVPPTQAGSVQAQVVVTSPPEGRFECRDAIIGAVNAAHGEILIENQYLWDEPLINALLAALKRGVKMRIIVPGDEDHGVFKYIHSDELEQLTKAGAQARLYNADNGTAHLHVKYFGVDAHWVAIGSANGDTRGFLDNQELDTVIDDPALAADFRSRLFEHDWAGETKPWVYKPGAPNTKPFETLLEIIEYYL